MSSLVLRPGAALVAIAGGLIVAASASAATLTVDDDKAQCPLVGDGSFDSGLVDYANNLSPRPDFASYKAKINP